jgi:hypothetical protein
LISLYSFIVDCSEISRDTCEAASSIVLGPRTADKPQTSNLRERGQALNPINLPGSVNTAAIGINNGM